MTDNPNARATEAEQLTDAQHMEVGGILACIYVDSANTVEKATPPLRVAPIRQQLRTLVIARDAALSRAEQAEKERDEARREAEELRVRLAGYSLPMVCGDSTAATDALARREGEKR